MATNCKTTANVNEHQEIVRVHRRGRNPAVDARPEVATRGPDGRLYVKDSVGRWWQLSNGASGWRSLNVGIGDAGLTRLLNDRAAGGVAK